MRSLTLTLFVFALALSGCSIDAFMARVQTPSFDLIDGTPISNSIRTNLRTGVFGLLRDSIVIADVQSDQRPLSIRFEGLSKVRQERAYLERRNLDGSLDLGFGTLGKTEIPDADSASGYDLAVLGDDRILISMSRGGQIEVFRFLSDGQTDASFGSAGKVTVPLSVDYELTNTTTQPDGKLLIAGRLYEMGKSRILIHRLLSNGSLDASFGSGGEVIISPTTDNQSAEDLAVDSDGKILLAGNLVTGSRKMLLVRLLSNGSLDPSFGVGGVVEAEGGASSPRFEALALQPDGKILGVGGGWVSAEYRPLVARFLTDGTPDSSFNGTGFYFAPLTNPGSQEQYEDVAVTSDGKVWLIGYSNSIDTNFIFRRLNSDGTEDPGSPTGGDLAHQVDREILRQIIALPDDHILIFGTSGWNQEADSLIFRLLPDGSFDSSFGVNGKLVVDTPTNSEDFAIRALSLPEGKTLVGGVSYGNGDSSFALARFLADGALDTSFGTNGIVVTESSPAVTTNDELVDLRLQSDGKILALGTRYPNVSQQEILVIRYQSDGTLDTTFGAGGIFRFVDAGWPEAKSLGILDDGSLLIGLNLESPTTDFALLRLDASGNLDAGFGSGGLATYDVIAGENEDLHKMEILPDGKILMIGASGPWSSQEVVFLRLLADGSVDPSYGNSGVSRLDLGDEFDMTAARRLEDGKWLIGGQAYDPSNDIYYAVLARMDETGNLDSDFGASGLRLFEFGEDSSALISGLDVQENGKIVVGLAVELPEQENFLVARLQADGRLDTAFGDSGYHLLAEDISATWGSSDSSQIAVDSAGVIRVIGTWLLRSDPLADPDFEIHLLTPRSPSL